MAQDFLYSDLGGGLNSDSGPAGTARNQFTALENWYPYGTKLRRRGGTPFVAAWSDPAGSGGVVSLITSMHTLKKRDGTWALICGGVGQIGLRDAPTSDLVTTIPWAPGIAVGSSDYPWVFFQYKDYLYGLRKGGNGKMFRISPSRVDWAGLTPPATAMTIAQGAAGDLVAGDYRTVCTFGNIETGYESNPGPVSNTLTLAASKKIDYSGIPTSTNPFLNRRRGYRCLENQAGNVFFRVWTIDDMTTTTYTGENVVVSALGPPVSFKRAVPPADLVVGCVWQERVYASDGRDLFYSETLQGEGFGTDSIFPVFPDDGHTIRALHLFGDRLIIGKTNKIHYLQGSSPATSRLHTLSDEHGCMSGHSMHSAEGRLFWYGSGKAVYMSDGNGAREISTPRIRKILEQIQDSREEYIIGAVFPEYNWYMLTVPDGRDDTETERPNQIVLVYNYKEDTWTTFTHAISAPQFFGQFFSPTGQELMYATFYDGGVFNYNDRTQMYEGAGSPINATFTKPLDDIAPGYRKDISEVWLLIPQTPNTTMRLEVLADELPLAVADRTVSLDVDSGEWKAYRLPAGRPGTRLALRGTYNGLPQIDIEGLNIRAQVLRRGPNSPR